MSDAWYAQPIESDPVADLKEEIERLRDALTTVRDCLGQSAADRQLKEFINVALALTSRK